MPLRFFNSFIRLLIWFGLLRIRTGLLNGLLLFKSLIVDFRLNIYCLFLISHARLTLITLTGIYLTVVSFCFFLECLILHGDILMRNNYWILSAWLSCFQHWVENDLFITQSCKRDLAIISWLHRYIILRPIKLSISNWKSFPR